MLHYLREKKRRALPSTSKRVRTSIQNCHYMDHSTVLKKELSDVRAKSRQNWYKDDAVELSSRGQCQDNFPLRGPFLESVESCFNSFADNMVTLSVSKTKLTGLLAGTCAFILQISATDPKSYWAF